MNADMDRIIDKIKKCLALSQSDNPNEAASALRQAQALMRKHGLDAAAVSDAEVGEADVDVQSANMRRPPMWEARLVVMVGEAFGCRALIYRDMKQGDGRRSKARYRYVGLTVNVLTAAYCTTVLLRQLRKSRNDHVKALRAEAKLEGWRPTAGEERSAGDAFCVGWLDAVKRQVSHFANPTGVDDAIARRCSSASEGRESKPTSNRIGQWDGSSIRAGIEAAKDVSLHRPVEQSGAHPALGFSAGS
jgi:hypothetical protein